MTAPPHRRSVFLGRMPLPERNFVAEALRTETVGGMLLLAAAVLALAWANSPLADGYDSVRDTHFGPGALRLDLSVGHWAADGLLTVFFFVAGIELKRELVAGELRTPSAAALPVVAAVCGMAVPALVYVVVNASGGGSMDGWAVPTATDIAFALAVLAVIGTSLPSALRAFLLTLAVVDDLLAILIIAVFFTSEIDLAALGLAAVGLALFWLLLRKGVRGWYVYVPLALANWALMHAGGVHATIAGVAMGLMLRCHRRPGEERSPGERVEHLVRPLSAGLAVPLFALFSAGVPVSGGALGEVFGRPETLGVVLGLIVGKAVGVFGGTLLAARFTRAELNPDLAWADVLALSSLAGIGFTVSLLIGELAFADDPALTDEVKAAVLVGSLISAVLAGVLLKLRDVKYRKLWEDEERDEDQDGIPDVYEQDDPEYHLRMAAIHEAKAAEHRRLAEAARSGAATGGGPDGSGMIGGQQAPERPHTTTEDAMSAADEVEERSLGQLVASATAEMSALVHEEIALAKAELRQDVKRAGIGGGAITAAGILALFALPVLSFAAAYGIHNLGLGLAWSFLIVGGAYLLVAAVLGLFAVAKFKKVKKPERSIASAKRTAAVLQGVKPHTRDARASGTPADVKV